MAEKENIDTKEFSKAGLVTDLNASYISKEQYSYARNAVRNSKEGDLGTIGNEPSTIRCYDAPYSIIGIISLPDDTHLVFSTDDVNSEIGIGDPTSCTYKALSKLSCLNFNRQYPITGEAKKDISKGVIVTFTDKYNPIRRIELKKIQSITCDTILLFKKIDQPCIEVTRGQVGNMPGGVYSIVMAYSVDNKVFTDWFSITNRIMLGEQTQSNSIEVEISNLDTEFKYYTIAVVGNYIDPTTKGATKLAKIIGTYSTKNRKVSITDFINNTYSEIKLSELIIKKDTWQRAGIISSNSNYLLLGDLVKREEENYQLKAMDIEIEYVVSQASADYYEIDGLDIGYYRDENYAFFIEGVYSTGEHTDKFHIPGPKKTSDHSALVSSKDVYEYDKQFNDCQDPGKIQRWQVENTAGRMKATNDKLKCNRRTLGYGVPGYFESTDLYPDNVHTFGEFANTPIRYAKMPDECKVPRYETIQGKQYINILGVRFKNIPKFDSPDIVGYRITRSDRKGGNGTVIARGLMTNIRSYKDPQIDQTILYSNYPVNDLQADVYLSSTQTSFKAGKESNFKELETYHKDKFTFYSPHTLFEPRYSLGEEIKIECEEIADITGKFEVVHNHPKQKLLNQFAFWLAAAVGFLESSFVLFGKTKFNSKDSRTVTTPMTQYDALKKTTEISQDVNIENIEDLIGLSTGDIIKLIQQSIKSGGSFLGVLNAIKVTIQGLAALGLKIPYSVFAGIVEADKTLDTIYNFTGYTDYVYQYNAHANFNKYICQGEGNKRRRVKNPIKYIPSDLVTTDNVLFNNYFREKTVYLDLNKPIDDPKTKDTSRGTISSFGICKDKTKTVKSVGSAFYATNKTPNPNQYGPLGSSDPVSMHSCVLSGETTPTLFGGDCIITRFQFMKKMQFFNQNLANTNYPPGTEYDYRLYRNIAYPRYWMDTTKYDFSQLLTKNVVNYTKFSRTTTGKYNLDCKKGKDGSSISRIDDAYMYTSNNCVIDFFVECDYNLNYREETSIPHYSKNNTNLSLLFRSDFLAKQEEFKINRVYSDIYTTEIFNLQQRSDFDPNNPIPVAQPNSIIYSLPSFNLQEVDNWQYFLPANFFAFSEGDFGTLTGIHKLDQDRIIFLFSKSSPYVSTGRDFLQLEGSGRKITIGDGGLFAQDPREILPTDNNYGACTSKYAFSNNHLGRYYPSENQGRVINYTDSLNDITREGMSFWCKNYMPINLYRYFPNYPKIENTISGVGYQVVFDSSYEIVYICKRDFVPRKEYTDNITYADGFKYKGLPITLESKYFQDVSWTLSYSPIDKAFISWHDWHPNSVIQSDTHFLTVKGSTVWKHNESTDSFCRFYDTDYPFEVEFISNSGQMIDTVRNVEYLLEVYKYKNFGRDRYHVLNENFDRLIVRNTEQISPLLNLVHGNPNPEENLSYPKRNTKDQLSWDIPFFKEENKYRVNQFWDITRDRGEFSNAEFHLFPTDESGYRSVINPVAVNVDRPEEERKKFRHYLNFFRFTKTISGPNKFLVKLFNIKKQNSPR